MSGEWRRWVAEAVGPGAAVVRVRRMHGGITSIVHAVDVVDARGSRHRLVLRRYPAGGVMEHELGLVAAEVHALRVLEDAGFDGAPRCVAADGDGRQAGMAAVLSSRLPGRPLVASEDVDGWCRGLAATVVDVCDRLRSVPPDGLPSFAPWYPIGRSDAVAPPAYVRDRVRWDEVMTQVADRLPAGARPPQVVHRDLNPGNVLWVRRRPAGVVDWVNLCVGPIEQDFGRCRVNLWLLGGRTAADAFRAEVDLLGCSYDPAWDLVAAAEMAPWLRDFTVANRIGARLTQDLVHQRMEELVTAR